MLVCINNYTVDYWQLNKIQDYGNNDNDNNNDNILSELELDIDNLSNEDKMLLLELEKIDNNNNKINNSIYNDIKNKNGTISRDSTICKSNTKSCNANLSTTYNKRVSNNGLSHKQKNNQHNILYKTTQNSKNNSKLHLLPPKSRISEYDMRERLLLLDSFTKPHLVKKIEN